MKQIDIKKLEKISDFGGKLIFLGTIFIFAAIIFAFFIFPSLSSNAKDMEFARKEAKEINRTKIDEDYSIKENEMLRQSMQQTQKENLLFENKWFWEEQEKRHLPEERM